MFIDHEAPQATKNHQDVRLYVRQISVIDNQRTLSQLSHKLEPRRPWALLIKDLSMLLYFFQWIN